MDQLWDVVRRQLGIVTRAQARALGVSDAAMEWWVHSGTFDRVLPEVFRHRAAHRSRQQFLVAVSLWLDGRGALASLTAGSILGLDRIPVETRVRLRRPGSGRVPHDDVIAVRGALPAKYIATVGLLSVTGPAWTLTDLAADLSRARFRSAAESALRRKLCTTRDVVDVMIDRGPRGWKGRRVVREWLDWRGEGPSMQFELEILVFDILKRHGLEPPSRQHPVLVDGIRYTLDFAWPDAEVGVECDGYESHGGREPFDRDRDKIAGITSTGWRVIPVTWVEASQHEERFASRVRASIRRPPPNSAHR